MASKRRAVFAINWMEVEALVNARHDNPHHILGIHECLDDVYVNAFIPGAKVVTVIDKKDKKRYSLISERYEGFFSICIKDKKSFDYELDIKYEDGTEQKTVDPYVFEPVIDPIDISRFNEGIHYEIYEKLGSHPMVVDGVKGTLFAVWAPNAERVSVVGNFNNWDGRRHQMRKLDYSGIFELFIPGNLTDEIYKYEIRSKKGDVFMKSDPYAFTSEIRPANASKVTTLDYIWHDKKWIDARSSSNEGAKDDKVPVEKPLNIYEVHLGSWKRPDDGREFYSYREIAIRLADYMKEMGYNYVELMPIMEHPYDPSWGYQITGYYAPTSRYGSPEEFMGFVDYMHTKGIGVIIDWVPAHFPRDEHGLGRFDGTPLYENQDPLRGEHPHWGTYIFDYGRNEVKNFLVANALYWADKYHIDGIRVDAVASMLYLDYGRNGGEWRPNIYGGNENLEAIAFIKEVNQKMKENYPGVIMIAEESTAWPMMTHNVEDGGMGFDYKWNMGWMNDFLSYMKLDPLYRKYHHNELTFSMMYAFSEKFILVLSHDEVVHEKGSMIQKMPGGYEDKFSNLRTAYGFMMTHPGKKLIFMGQEFAQFAEFNESSELDWSLFEFDAHRCIQDYVKELNKLYNSEPALYEYDSSPEGFNWISVNDANRSIVSYERNAKNEKDTLVVVCNFTPVEQKNYKLGVPSEGKWQEIFSSDNAKFGGEGKNNKTVRQTKVGSVDERNQYIQITVPALSVSVFKKKSGSKSPAKKTAK
ncbi:1,4-alpha-glucan branching protein GlgB [Eubacterium ruminantium]|uniref:1,4-alpha-glucan branching protein GlgB n=1 Tax=Eubacterium ruminantium TaxID=42322 RepID=UPI00247A6771|nr:1,4-alpha-glucan branching protein GlgB [Eubacterium ruminantium]